MATPVSTSIIILFSSSNNIPIIILIEGKEFLIAIGIRFWLAKLVLETVTYIAKKRVRLSEVFQDER